MPTNTRPGSGFSVATVLWAGSAHPATLRNEQSQPGILYGAVEHKYTLDHGYDFKTLAMQRVPAGARVLGAHHCCIPHPPIHQEPTKRSSTRFGRCCGLEQNRSGPAGLKTQRADARDLLGSKPGLRADVTDALDPSRSSRADR